MRTMLGAYAGREEQTRADAEAALTASMRCGAHILAVWPITALAFLELSLENHEAALTTLKPLLRQLDKTPDALEICTAPFVADAVEALIRVDQLAEAETLIERLERRGRLLDRPRLLAVGGRCRSMLLAVRGEVGAATKAARQALAHHERLPMPLERARTQLVYGQLNRRQRRRNDASADIGAALRCSTISDARRGALAHGTGRCA